MVKVSIKEWTDKQKLLSVHTVEYYSALNRKEILTYAITWMNPEDIILSESQSPQDKYGTNAYI